jgi:hypothetical protein
MAHSLHQSVVDLIHQGIDLMDDLMRDKIDLPGYTLGLKGLDADGLLFAHREEFKRNPDLVYYLDALMIVSSLQHELDFQVTEYGVNVVSEDIKMLKELLPKLRCDTI